MRLIVRRSSPAQRHLAQAIGLGERLMPADGSIDGFVAAVGAHRGRPVRVIGYPLDAAGPSGLWIGTCASDYVVCSADATPTRRAAILCHELAHMLLGHEPEVGDTEALSLVAKVLAPDVDVSVATRFLTRHGYAGTAEEDAEAAATALVMTAANRQRAAIAVGNRVSERLR